MKVDVLSMSIAERYEPNVPTLAIRIFSTPYFAQAPREELFHRDKFVDVFEYTFDDVGYGELRDKCFMGKFRYHQGKMLGPISARKIVADFESKIHEIDALMIHCYAGTSRSPAVALALNQLFNLRQRDLWSCFNETYNQYVYDTIVQAGESLRR